MRRLIQKWWALALLALMSPHGTQACSICYGEPESPTSRGLTWAITGLGAIVVCVLGGAVAFFVHANRRATVLEAADSANSLIEKN